MCIHSVYANKRRRIQYKPVQFWRVPYAQAPQTGAPRFPNDLLWYTRQSDGKIYASIVIDIVIHVDESPI